MNKYRKSISIIVAIVMLFTLQFSFSFAETADESDPIVILHTNDMHSKVDGELSLASVKGWKDYYEAKGSAVLILDSGDVLHGLPVANLSRGENIVDIMNEVGYTAMTPGNHDFNYGTARLKELSELMDFDLLSANFTDKSGTAVFTPSKIYTAGDKKIGIVGISTPETATKTNPLNVAGYQFNEAELASLVQAQIDSLKAEGADYIVALGHLGLDEESEPYRSSDLISQISGLDIFVDGHSHTSLANGEAVKDKDGNEVVLAQTGSQLKAIGKIGIDGENIAASLITEPKEDAAIKALEAEQQAEIKPMLDKVVAKTDVLLDGNRDPGVRTQETNLGDLGADALKYVSGADVALTNGGGIRASIEIGDITYGEINTVFPFGNTVVTIEITGADLLAALQHGTASAPTASGGFPQVAGMNYEVHTYLQADRVQNVTINGEPLDLQKTYTLATNDFTQVGGDGYTMLAGYEKTGEYGALDEALATYIEKALNGTVDNRYAKAQNRIKVMLTPYTDMVSHWAGASVATVVNKNLFKGVSETSFLPNASMTRAMFITVLGRMDGVDIAAYQSTEFEDVTMDSWYGAYVEWADDNEIASGITETKFAPETPITREQMATILTNYCTYKGQGPVGAWAIQLKYTDLERVSDWAGEGVMFATMKAYMTGYADGSFGPQNKATRAETAVIISRFLAAQEPITTTGSGITTDKETLTEEIAMQIIVAGCGKVGSQFARIMSEEGHEVAVVDSSSENFKLLGPSFHGVTVLGVPIDEDVLKQAGIESADGFAALTPDDNINMMACQIAKEIFRIPRIFARIQDPVKEQVFYQFGVHTVCPTDMTVQEFRALMIGECSTKTCYIDNTGIEFIYERVRTKDAGKMMKEISVPKNTMILGIMKNGELNFYNPSTKLEFDDELVIVRKI